MGAKELKEILQHIKLNLEKLLKIEIYHVSRVFECNPDNGRNTSVQRAY